MVRKDPPCQHSSNSSGFVEVSWTARGTTVDTNSLPLHCTSPNEHAEKICGGILRRRLYREMQRLHVLGWSFESAAMGFTEVEDMAPSASCPRSCRLPAMPHLSSAIQQGRSRTGAPTTAIPQAKPRSSIKTGGAIVQRPCSWSSPWSGMLPSGSLHRSCRLTLPWALAGKLSGFSENKHELALDEASVCLCSGLSSLSFL